MIDLSPLIKASYEYPPRLVPVFDLSGSKIGEVELPDHFFEVVRVDLIRRAYLSAFTARLQPKGTDPMAGNRKSAQSFGVGLGIARVPRYKGHLFPRAAFAPNTVGGRRAHPPKVEKILHEEINKKERRLAIRSAIAATGIKHFVVSRGHVVNTPFLPLVVHEDAERVRTTVEAKKLFKALGLWDDVERAHERIRVRAGRGKMRGRRYKEPKSVLVVTGSYSDLIKACRNFPGVDAVYVDMLSVLHLAPGGVPGRLTLWTVEAVRRLNGLFRV